MPVTQPSYFTPVGRSPQEARAHLPSRWRKDRTLTIVRKSLCSSRTLPVSLCHDFLLRRITPAIACMSKADSAAWTRSHCLPQRLGLFRRHLLLPMTVPLRSPSGISVCHHICVLPSENSSRFTSQDSLGVILVVSPLCPSLLAPWCWEIGVKRRALSP